MAEENVIPDNSAGEPAQNVIMDGGFRGDEFDIDSLIPEELRAAVGRHAEEEEEDEVEQDVNHVKPAKPADDLPRFRSRDSEGEDEEDDEDEAPVPPTKAVESEDSDEDLDLSPEAIDKLIKGDTEAIVKKAVEEDAPFWKEDAKYKSVTQRLSKLGMKTQDIDELIQSVTDKNVVDTSKLVKGLETRAQKAENDAEHYKSEISRLRQIERGAYFDGLEEVREKYGVPMTQAIQEIHSVLKREGISVSVQKLLEADNKTAMISLLDGASLEDTDLSRITNQWRSYKEVEQSYIAAKAEAQKNLKEGISTKIAPETVESILKVSLKDFMGADPKYKYINEAISDDISKHPEVSDLLGVAKANFQNLVQAISNPSETIHNQKYLATLAKYVFDSAHNRLYEKKYRVLESDHSKAIDSMKKLVRQYKKLADSAKGITGARSGVGAVGRNTQKSAAKETKRIVKEFEELLKNEKAIDKIIP